jgi:WD40 repeat protein
MTRFPQKSAQLRGTIVYRLLLDVDRLVSVYHPAIRLGALYVYHSAVVTMPDCLLWRQFDSVECAAHIPVLITERASDWGARVRVLEGHAGYVTSVAFSHDDRFIVSGAHDRTVRVWDTATDTVQHVWSGHTSRVTAVAFSPTSYTVASCSTDGTVRLWDVIRGSEICVIDGHTAPVWCVTFSPDGQRIATGSEDCTVRVWDTAKGTQKTIMVGHNMGVTSVAFAPNSQLVTSGSYDETVRVWDAVTGTGQHAPRIHPSWDQGLSVAFSPENTCIASACFGNTVTVFVLDAATGAQRIASEDSKGRLCVTYSPNGRWIATGTRDGSIEIWDAATGTKQHVTRSHRDWVRAVAFSSDSRLVVSGSEDHTIQVWDLSNDITHPDRTAAIRIVAFSPDGTMVLLCTDQTTHVRHTTTGAQLYTLEDHGHVYDAAFSFDSAFVITGSDDKTVRVWDAATGKQHRVLRGHQTSVISVATSSNSHLIASVCEEYTVRVWDAMSGIQLHEISSSDRVLGSYVTLSPGNRLVAANCAWGGALVWDVATGIRQKWITPKDLSRVGVAFSQDGQWAAGAARANVHVWEVATGALRHVMRGHSVAITSIEFLPRSSLIASRCTDNTIQVWDADTGAALGPPQPGMPAATPFPTTQVLASPFFSVDRAGWVWRLSTSGEWRRVSWLPIERRGIFQASWGQKLCVGGDSGSITLLDFSNVE